MKILFVFIAGIFLFLSCSDSGERKEPATEKKDDKKDSKTSISISPDSVGITTKEGNKVSIRTDSGAFENKDVKIKAKRDSN